MRHAVEDHARDLLDDVDLACHVARAPGRNGYVPFLAHLEAEPDENRPLLVLCDRETDHAVGVLRPKPDDRAFGQTGMHVGAADELAAGQIDDQPAGEDRGRLGQVRVDAFLPAVGAGRPQPQALRGLEDADRLEVRGLEEDLGRRVGDLGLLPAHDRCERDRLARRR